MTEALDAARAGAGKIVLIGGEAGIGKTSLVRAFLEAHLRRQDWALGTCEALTTPEPLAPFREVAASIGGAVGRLFALSASPDPVEVLAELQRARKVALVLEDVHWADQASLDLLRYLGRRAGQLNSLLVVTYRNDELSLDHPFRQTLGGLATSPDVQRINLQPLSAAAVRQLSSSRHIDADGLYRQTRGNPFFVAEVLAQDHTGEIPSAVRDLIGARIAMLDEQQRQTLRLIGLLGQAEPRLLQFASPTAAADIDAAIAAGLLRSADGKLAFPHDLTRQAVVETISPPHAVVLHGRALDTLLRSGSTDTARLAAHAEASESSDAIRRFSPVAAREAASAGAHREAASHYRTALRVEVDPRARALLLGGYGAECTTLDQTTEAIAAHREACSLWQQLHDDRQWGTALSALASPLFAAGRNAEAAEYTDQAIAVLEPLGPSPELAAALRGRAQLFMLEREKTQALHFGRRAIAMAEAVGDLATLAAANHTVAITLLVADDLQGRNYLERSMQLAREQNLDGLVSLGLLNAGSAYGEQYRFDDAERYLTHGIAFARERDLDAHRKYDEAWLALVQLFTGRLEDAEKTATALLAEDDVATTSQIMALAAIGRSRARRGLASLEALDRALELAGPTRALQRIAPVRLARAEAAWLAGDVKSTVAEAGAVWGEAVGHRHQWLAGEALYWLQRGGAPPSVPRWIAPPYAAALAGRWQDSATLWNARKCPYEQARALADGDRPAQLEALSIFDRLGALPAAGMLRQQMRQAGDAHIPRGPRPTTRQSNLGLTRREQEIAGLVAADLTNAAIAARLSLSAKTVEHHVTSILAKLSATTRAEVAGRLDPGTDSSLP